MANNGYLSHTILLSYPVFPFVALRINWAVWSDCDTNVAWLASTDVVVPLICFAKKTLCIWWNSMVTFRNLIPSW